MKFTCEALAVAVLILESVFSLSFLAGVGVFYWLLRGASHDHHHHRDPGHRE